MITKKEFGKTLSGEQVDIYTLSNGSMEYSVITYGGTLQSIKVPSKTGKLVDVLLGYDTIEEYQSRGGYLGAIIGRVGNRIGYGKFNLNGKEYQLFCNEKLASLHGGKVGFDKKVWKAEIVDDTLELSYLSVDGEENYPGNLAVKVIYSLTSDNELKIHYLANSDKDTLCNLTNHAYFNVNGQDAGSARDVILKIDADAITPIGEGLLPDGKFMDVTGTPFDFRKGKPLGDGIDDVSNEQIAIGRGCFDHNFVLNKKGFGWYASAYSEKTGIKMDCYTDLPGVQLYAGGSTAVGKGGVQYVRFGAFCLETQVHPNAINCPEYPSIVLKAGDTYDTVSTYKFSVEK